MFEVSEQHGRHDALLCVDGKQGGGGLLQLQRHQDQGSAADCLPSKPAGESENTGQLHHTTETDCRKYWPERESPLNCFLLELLSSKEIVPIRTENRMFCDLSRVIGDVEVIFYIYLVLHNFIRHVSL